jgi:hypothetical protein
LGKPSPTGVEQANQVLFGTFTNTGTTTPMLMYGSFNVAIWGHLTSNTLTTTNGTNTAGIGTNSGLTAGQYISSTNVPYGSTIGSVSTNTLVIDLAPGDTNTQITTGVDATAVFGPATWGGIVQVERSFDGGMAWVIAGVGGGGTGAIYSGATQNGTPVSIVPSEPERGMLYRLNCTSYTSGTIRWRISASGLAAMAWGVPPG